MARGRSGRAERIPHETDKMLYDVLTAQPGHVTVAG